MSYASVVGEVETILKSATGVVSATVWKYDKLASHMSTYISYFKDTGNNVIHGYTITRARVESLPEASRVNKVISTWIIRGFYSYKDHATFTSTSEYKFQVIVDNIRAKFRADPRLNSSVLTSTPLQVDVIEPRMFGDVLCHYAEMRLGTEEEETFS